MQEHKLVTFSIPEALELKSADFSFAIGNSENMIFAHIEAGEKSAKIALDARESTLSPDDMLSLMYAITAVARAVTPNGTADEQEGAENA